MNHFVPETGQVRLQDRVSKYLINNNAMVSNINDFTTFFQFTHLVYETHSWGLLWKAFFKNAKNKMMISL